MRKLDNRDDVIRAFWAAYIGSEVAKDGQVAGFSSFESGMTQAARDIAWKAANGCLAKIRASSDPPEQVIVDQVRIAQQAVQSSTCGSAQGMPTAEQMIGLTRYYETCKSAWENGISPYDTAQQIRQMLPEHPWLIEEVVALESMGDTWLNADQHRELLTTGEWQERVRPGERWEH